MYIHKHVISIPRGSTHLNSSSVLLIREYYNLLNVVGTRLQSAGLESVNICVTRNSYGVCEGERAFRHCRGGFGATAEIVLTAQRDEGE